MLTQEKQRILNIAAEIEDISQTFYSEHAGAFKDQPDVAEIFEQLRQDEESHRSFFLKMQQDTGEPIKLSEEDVKRMETMDPRRYFARLEQNPNFTQYDILESAYQFEKGTVQFYLEFQELVGESTELSTIIATEKSHMERLLKILVSGGRFYGLSDTWP